MDTVQGKWSVLPHIFLFDLAALTRVIACLGRGHAPLCTSIDNHITQSCHLQILRATASVLLSRTSTIVITISTVIILI